MAELAEQQDAPADRPGAPRTTTRLMIREMVLENFKSYAGEQRVGPFHKSFSAVVGPNGSGKSNVIDAMLFVFGRRAKQLRFNKVSELIHNSASHQNLECAKVSVYFQEIIDKDGGDFDVVPNSAFVVARTAHRNNESNYFVSNRKVSAKDVVELLKGKGIDLDNNRFLILQGEVEQISLMKPKAEDKNDTGLLEYLEDIIGTDQYVTPIEEAGKKLEKLSEARAGMTARLRAAEAEKDALSAKAAEALAYLAKQGDMYRLKANSQYSLHLAAKANETEAERKIGELGEKLAHEKGKLSSQDKDMEEIEAKHAAAEKEHDRLARELEAATKAFKDLENRNTQVSEDIKHASARIKAAAAKETKEQAALQKSETEAAALEAAGPAAAAQAESLSAELAGAEGTLEALVAGTRGEVDALHAQLSKVRAELAPWESQMGEVDARRKVAEGEAEVLSRRADEARKRLDKAVDDLQTAKSTATERASQAQQLAQELEACQRVIAGQRNAMQTAQAAEQQAEAAVKALAERLAGLKAEVFSSQGQSGVMGALQAAKAAGEVAGLHGRLGDLASIDAKYDTAMSTACGALDFIVVETASDAQRCVESLRRSGAGVATCLILEKQRHLESAAAQKLDTPEGVPRLYDLIKLSPAAQKAGLHLAFYHSLQNTVVAKDLEQASRIAYGQDRRFRRVVTLAGQLIANSGTMSGGGRPVSGKMALGSAAPRGTGDAKAAEAEMRGVESELSAASRTRGAASAHAAEAERALRDAERKVASLEVALPKAQMDAAAQAQRAGDIEAQLDKLQQETQVSADEQQRIDALRNTASKEAAALAKLQSQAAGLQSQAQAIQTKIDNAGGDKLKKQKAAVAKLRSSLESLETESSRRKVQAKTTAKAIEKARKDIVKLLKDKEKAEAELAALRAEDEKVMEEGAVVQERISVADAAVKAAAAELQEASSKYAILKGTVDIIRKTVDTIEEKMQELGKVAKDEAKKSEAFKRELLAFSTKYAELKLGEDAGPVVDEAQYMHDPPLTPGQLLKRSEDAQLKAVGLEADLGGMSPDMSAIEDHKAKEADWATKKAELDAATRERDTVRAELERLRKTRLDGFMSGFQKISEKLKEMYQMITLGGDAELELVDALDPFSEGIIFSVRPPRKSWKAITNLSGGEKTLASLSLVFALHHYKPNPLYVMDEIDAALDYKNVSIVGHYIKERTSNAQFIIISLRNNMFELADRLVGIYKTDFTTKTVAINPAEFVVPVPSADSGSKQAAVGQKDQGSAQEKAQADKGAAGAAAARSAAVGVSSPGPLMVPVQ